MVRLFILVVRFVMMIRWWVRLVALSHTIDVRNDFIAQREPSLYCLSFTVIYEKMIHRKIAKNRRI